MCVVVLVVCAAVAAVDLGGGSMSGTLFGVVGVVGVVLCGGLLALTLRRRLRAASIRGESSSGVGVDAGAAVIVVGPVLLMIFVRGAAA